MALGLGLVAIAVVLYSAKYSISTKAQVQNYQFAARQKTVAQPRSAINLAGTSSTGTNIATQTGQSSPASSVHYPSEKIKTQKFHIVRNGDTLFGIACEYYGSANKLQKILDANRDIIKDANKLRAGTKLIIPE